jgi:hypothetical protein
MPRFGEALHQTRPPPRGRLEAERPLNLLPRHAPTLLLDEADNRLPVERIIGSFWSDRRLVVGLGDLL